MQHLVYPFNVVACSRCGGRPSFGFPLTRSRTPQSIPYHWKIMKSLRALYSKIYMHQFDCFRSTFPRLSQNLLERVVPKNFHNKWCLLHYIQINTASARTSIVTSFEARSNMYLFTLKRDWLYTLRYIF